MLVGCFCPRRWMRATAWALWQGFHGQSQMTIRQALVRLIPSPPARVDIRKHSTWLSGLLKLSMSFCLFCTCVVPSRRLNMKSAPPPLPPSEDGAQPKSLRCSSISSSVLVLWLNTTTFSFFSLQNSKMLSNASSLGLWGAAAAAAASTMSCRSRTSMLGIFPRDEDPAPPLPSSPSTTVGISNSSSPPSRLRLRTSGAAAVAASSAARRSSMRKVCG
mmetsp:Transcript_39258/g.111139  ORF Transcript_39258/g.111139 Transcript_39258/m.111139 type:complete len:218 (+) Transcript_39258:862-1515(+)